MENLLENRLNYELYIIDYVFEPYVLYKTQCHDVFILLFLPFPINIAKISVSSMYVCIIN